MAKDEDEAHGDLAINAYAEGDETKCSNEDEKAVVIYQATNGHVW